MEGLAHLLTQYQIVMVHGIISDGPQFGGVHLSVFAQNGLVSGNIDDLAYEVRLDHTGTSYWYRGAIYYTVTIETKAGYKVSADTKPLWSGGAFASFRLDDYNNKKIEIAYNQNTDEMMVLRK